MMTGYKFVNSDMTSEYGNVKWVVGEWQEVEGELALCCNGFHCYDSAEVAELRNIRDANYGEAAHLYECEWEGDTIDHRGLKRVVRKLRITQRIERPKWTPEQLTLICIGMAKEVRELWGECPIWDKWAANYKDGTDRSKASADAARAAANAAAYAVARAAYAAAYAARAAANAAARAADAADAGARAGNAAAAAICAAARAAEADAKPIDFAAIIRDVTPRREQ